MRLSRIAVVGVTGSGKTTFAQELSRRLQLPHVELDALFWEPGWKETERDVFRARVSQALAGEAWVVDGNYSQARDLVWGWADTLVWLDYPLATALWRLTVRTARRIVRREELWNGNRESLREFLFSGDSLYAWAVKSYRKHRATYPIVVTDYPHLKLVRLRSPGEAQAWMDGEACEAGGTSIHT